MSAALSMLLRSAFGLVNRTYEIAAMKIYHPAVHVSPHEFFLLQVLVLLPAICNQIEVANVKRKSA
jgi:hypothetical protein